MRENFLSGRELDWIQNGGDDGIAKGLLFLSKMHKNEFFQAF